MNRILVLVLGVIALSCANKKNQKVIAEEAFENLIEPTDPKSTEVYEPLPPTVNPTGQNGVPSDAIVLFDGSNFNAWEMVENSNEITWDLNDDKSMTIHRKEKNVNACIQTKQSFGSCQLHIEWKSPEKISGKGQHCGNSGVFFHGLYKLQILDNNDNDTYVNGLVGSIYKQSIPLAKASVPTGEWNSYDVIYHAPEFEGNKKIKSGTITVLHNGVLIQDHFEIQGTSEFIGWPKNPPHGKRPIMLQDHNSPVSFKNIWIRELK
jgi:hypothetical protein